MKTENLVTKKIALIVSFVFMIAVNALSNTTILNNRTTAEVSDMYENLFAPAGITFAIWGIIYVLLLIALIYYVFLFKTHKTALSQELVDKIIFTFIITNVLNGIWLLLWQYLHIELSAIVMMLLLFLLLGLNYRLKSSDPKGLEYISSKLAFQVYFGWITIATVANITTMLVKLNWNKLGLSEVFWMVLVLIVAAAIVVLNSMKLQSIPYLLVGIWSFGGIVLKHVTVFALEYRAVVLTASLGILLFAAVFIYLFIGKIKNGTMKIY